MSTTTFEADLVDAPTGLVTFDAAIEGVPMMNEQEARATVTRIKTRIDIARGELLELHDREGWKALGYKSWEACARQEFGGSAAQMYRLLSAAQIERAIDSPIGEYPESHLREVAQLDTPDQQKQALDQARAKTNGKPTAKDVRQAAAEISAPELPIDFSIVQRRLAAHGITLTHRIQNGVLLFVRQRGTGISVAAMEWQYILDELERLEATPDPDLAAPAFRMTCPTCGETILNGIWGDLKECGSCWHTRQRAPAAPPPASDRLAHFAKEQDDRDLLSTAEANISIGNHGDARRLLAQVQVMTYARDQLLHTLDRAGALAFLVDQTARLSRFSDAAMISQTTFKAALDHIAALLERSV